MAADNILGKLIIEGANQAASMAGGSPSLGSGLAGGGGSNGNAGGAAGERETRGFQKTIRDANVKAVGFAKEQPKWWTKMFKTLGIQMGLAGILKQSQVFTSTVGAFFQIFGAMVDVMLAPLIKPVLMPLMRWFSRQIPTMGRLSKAVFGFLGSTIMGLIGWVKKIGGWISDGWDFTKKLFTADWWKKAFSTVVSAISTAGTTLLNGITKLFSWSTWHDIFRELWNATLGGKSIWKLDIPTWNGASPKRQKENSDAFDTANNEGSFNDSSYGTPRSDPTYTPDPNRVINQSDWNRLQDGNEKDKSLVETIGDVPGGIKKMFEEFGVVLKGAAIFAGLSTSAAAALKIKSLITGGISKVVNLGLAPGKVALGIVRGIAQQINPFAQEAFIGQVARGQGIGKNALGKAMGAWKGNMLKDLGLGGGPDVPSVIPRGGGPDIPTTNNRSIGDINRSIRSGMPVADDSAGARSSKATSTLVKARMMLSQLTSWLTNKLKNLKSLMSPTAFKQAEGHLATKTREIMALLKTIPTNTPGVASIVSRLSLLKSFLVRAIPLVGAAVGAVMTGKNIKTILGTDLSWFTANENTQAAQETNAQIAESLTRASGAVSEGEKLWKEGGLGNKFKAMGSFITAGIMGEAAADEGMQGYMSHTKGGAILNQLLLGSVSTGTGLFGVAGMPAGASAVMAQELAMADVRNNSQDIELYNQMLLAAKSGARGIGNELNIKIDGHDGTMDVPW